MCVVLIHNQHWYFQIFPLQRSSILKHLLQSSWMCHLCLAATCFCFQLLVAQIKNWLRKHQYISFNCYTRLILFFSLFNIFSKIGFLNILWICKCLLWLCFPSTVWSAFQLKINKGSQLVLKFSSVWADVAIVCLARTITFTDISEFENEP